jgi:hypothetical protein
MVPLCSTRNTSTQQCSWAPIQLLWVTPSTTTPLPRCRTLKISPLHSIQSGSLQLQTSSSSSKSSKLNKASVHPGSFSQTPWTRQHRASQVLIRLDRSKASTGQLATWLSARGNISGKSFFFRLTLVGVQRRRKTKKPTTCYTSSDTNALRMAILQKGVFL